MDNLMVFDDKAKKRIGILNFVPAICFFLTLVYYLYLLFPAFTHPHAPASAVAITSDNYNTLLTMLAASAVISACVLVYNIIILARVRNMNAQEKMIWIVVLATFVPIAFILFWVFVVRKEPRFVGTYPDIA